MQCTSSGKFTTQFLDGRTLFFRFAGRGVVFICCRINAALSFSPPAVAESGGATVLAGGDMFVAEVAECGGASVIAGGDMLVAECGGATVLAGGGMLVAEFGGGTTLGGGTALVGVGGAGASVDIFVAECGGDNTCNEQPNLITTPGVFFFKLRRYPGLFFLIF
jgi:hypothetical protein